MLVGQHKGRESWVFERVVSCVCCWDVFGEGMWYKQKCRTGSAFAHGA